LILWLDKIWVTGGRYYKQWVIKRAGEELNNTCVIDKIKKKYSWIFWACFAGDVKGLCLF